MDDDVDDDNVGPELGYLGHSYILLHDKPEFRRGTLLEQDEPNVGNGRLKFCEHWHYSVYDPTDDEFDILPPTVNINIGDVDGTVAAELTKKECRLLDAIDSKEDRYALYRSSVGTGAAKMNKLKWGVGLKVGDTVLAQLPSPSESNVMQYAVSVIRWIGIADTNLDSSFNWRRHRFGVEITEGRYRGRGNTDGFSIWRNDIQRYFECEENCGLFLTLDKMGKDCRIENQPEESAELRRVREELDQCRNQLQQCIVSATLSVVQLQQQLMEKEAQLQQLREHINAALANQRDALDPQVLELWDLPREEVHLSQTILGTGGWGYVAKGTFRGQSVAVKCLHRGIISPHNEGKMRREISLMAQVRHPNLLLLIGAVLTAEGEGPLIVTELLDRSLRSAYEQKMFEERSKVPVLRDVASALAYLHSHRTPIIHRDVSSANVLLEAIRSDYQWKGKLSDFGSANLSHLATTPAEGAVVYAAPEVITVERSRQTAKIDVYSFGVLVCEVCLCCFPPAEVCDFPLMLNDVRGTAPNMFSLARDCTSCAPQDRPAIRRVLDQLNSML